MSVAVRHYIFFSVCLSISKRGLKTPFREHLTFVLTFADKCWWNGVSISCGDAGS